MQQEQTITVTVDDLDHESPADTQPFTFDGQSYEIDLSEHHVVELKEALHGYELALQRVLQFVSVARPIVDDESPEPESEAPTEAAEVVAEVTKPRRRRGSKNRSVTDADVRTWARANGYEVGVNGRVAKSIREAFIEAHQ